MQCRWRRKDAGAARHDTRRDRGEASDGICGIDAILQDSIPGRVTLYGLVLAKRFQQISKGLLRNIFNDDSLAQRDEDGVRRCPS